MELLARSTLVPEVFCSGGLIRSLTKQETVNVSESVKE